MDGGQHVSVGGMDFWVQSEGSGPVVLLIAGLGYASWFWKPLSGALRDEFRVIRLDNRGTGRSAKPPAPYSIPMLADDAAAVLQACGANRAHVIGHSMGGYIAQALAQRHAALVERIVLASTAGGGPECLPVPPETMRVWASASRLSPQEQARMSMPLSFAPGWTEQHPREFEHILKQRLEYPTPTECWRAQFNACEDFLAEPPVAPHIRAPALVVHGTEDRVLPYANGELLARMLPHARLQRLEGIGHLPPLEDPAGFALLVRQFMGETTT
jgi:3-oxoadipate enol-lactonase